MIPFIPLSRPDLDDREIAAAARVLRSGWVTQGPEVERFERAFAAAVDASHACACSSGTAALHLALTAIGVGPGDEVVTVSHSFIATATAVRYLRAMPVFVDIDPSTFNIDPARIEDVITARTRAILCVHQVGMPCDLRAIVDIARRRGLVVVEDAACAAGSEILSKGRWERIGRPHGDIACFSFHPRKVLTMGEGGMVTTARADWDSRIRRLRQHGMTLPAHERHAARVVTTETYEELGYNYRLSDIQAAIGQVQVERLPSLVAARRRLAARYTEHLRGVAGVVPPLEPAWARSNWQTYCVWLPEEADQHDVMQRMLDSGVASRPAVMCAHREPAYARGTWTCGTDPGPSDSLGPSGPSASGSAGGTFACGCAAGSCRRLVHSERARDHAIQLPLFPSMTDSEQTRVIEVLARAIAESGPRLKHLTDPQDLRNLEVLFVTLLVSIVTPAFNEAENLPALYERLSAALHATAIKWEWIIVDDHSADATFETIAELSRSDYWVRGYRLARNSGSHAAITCGLAAARGAATVVLTADMQDPPEIVPALVAAWQDGAQVVWAARDAGGLPPKRTSRLYYLLMRRVVGLRTLAPMGADCVLLDRVVVKAVRRFGEQHVSLLALINWMGFRQRSVPCPREARTRGRSGWTFRRKVELVLDSVTGFTYLPIRVMSYFGLATAAAGLIYAIVVMANTMAGRPPVGWSSLMVAVLLIGGVQMLMLGVLGEYIWRALEESRRRPRYLIEATTGGDRGVERLIPVDRERYRA